MSGRFATCVTLFVILCASLGLLCGSLGLPHNWQVKKPPASSALTLQPAGRHAGAVLSLAFLSKSSLALSSGIDETAKIWDVATGKLVKAFSGPRFKFQDIAISVDGRHALTPGPDKSLHWWSLDSGRDERTYSGASGQLTTVALSADNKLAAAAGDDAAIRVWDTANGQQLRVWQAGGPVIRIAFEGGGTGLASIRRDGRLCRWDFKQDEALTCANALAEPVSAGAFSASTKQSLLASSYGTLVLWDVERGRQMRNLVGSSGDIVAVLFLSSTRGLSGGADKHVRLWNLDTGAQIAENSIPGGYVSALASSADGKIALIGTDQGTVTAWNLN
jgi:WD40 repeat protein